MTILPAELAGAVLEFLGVAQGPPDLALLDRLLGAYGRRVPWESASRIARRWGTAGLNERPRWAGEFWRQAIAQGTGGTCFESNLAFLALLKQLGFESYLTINNMGETRGCHTAIVVLLHGRRWLADAGYPLYAAVPLDTHRATGRETPFFHYSARPVATDEYLIEGVPHPTPYLFNLIDQPVDPAEYCRATADDYGEGGLFLNRIIIRKIVGEQIWRFDSDAKPYHLQTFHAGQRSDHPIEGDVVAALSAHYGIAPGVLAAAFDALPAR
ncbi:MAG TPA: arylamine N-acetyltransferase [Kouleothrix sp.]|uniref:arylamine N-acetyltransferase n=1 Tax=Kouleothrix sp. TaxID=2779161 RepID=UPI002C084E43|nr:arylamine N-acetyltransferase [Kouleothrix sp.]HRC75502.1 arylamine N-acetyltransferase [Kouleothrix sp.]